MMRRKNRLLCIRPCVRQVACRRRRLRSVGYEARAGVIHNPTMNVTVGTGDECIGEDRELEHPVGARG